MVLTAAHCFKDPDSPPVESMTVISGAKEPTNPEDLDKRRDIQQRKIERVVTHPLYEWPAAKFDLVIVKLDESLTFKPSTWPICVPEKEGPRQDHRGKSYTLLGYGRDINNEERGESLTTELLQVKVSLSQTIENVGPCLLYYGNLMKIEPLVHLKNSLLFLKAKSTCRIADFVITSMEQY